MMNTVYEANKKLDELFDQQYHTFDSTIIQMNIVELCVEIAECANETRCFKYWSTKKPSDSSLILEELADCILMALCFCNYRDIVLPEVFDECKENDINLVFQKLFYLASSLDETLDVSLILLILTYLVHLASLLHFSHEQIVNACMNKIRIVEQRLHSDY